MDLRETEEQRAVREEYAAWLADFLPTDYYDKYDDYRWDLPLRRAHQVAAGLLVVTLCCMGVAAQI